MNRGESIGRTLHAVTVFFLFCCVSLLASEQNRTASFVDIWLIEPQDYLSRTVLETTDAMDIFFSGPYSEAESMNRTYLRAQSGLTFIERESRPVEHFDFTARIRLPRTEKLFYFEVETLEPNDNPNTDTTERDNARTVQDPTNNLAAALRLMVHSTKSFSLQANVGVRVDMPLDPFVRFRARKSVVVYRWEHRLVEDLYYFLSLGWESTISYTVSRVFDRQNMLQFPNSVIYKPRNDSYGLNNAVHYHYRSDEQNGWLGFVGIDSLRYGTGPWMAQTYYSGLRYRRKVIASWLLFDIEPQLRWPVEQRFRTTPQLRFNLIVYIGHV